MEQEFSISWVDEQLPEGKTLWKRFPPSFGACFSHVLRGIFPWIRQLSNSRKEAVAEKSFFPGFEWDFPVFWEERIFWKRRFPLFLGRPGAGSAGVWSGFGNFWIQTQQENPGMFQHCSKVGFFFPKIPILGSGFPHSSPWSCDGREFFFGEGELGSENPKSSALEQLRAGN